MKKKTSKPRNIAMSRSSPHRLETPEQDEPEKESPNEIFTFTDFDLTRAEDYVRRKPQNSLLIAFAAGFLASVLLRRK